ncbi:MAG: hypothetical protein KF732_02175 [Flavobacteriales bacterium]|nr:hypothetical protein [Flavobacteriales bacterium]MBX2958739.1 hypothetical protein [Flavobacteriales bacterium]
MQKELEIELTTSKSILRMYNCKVDNFNFLNEIINIKIYLDGSQQPFCDGDIANLIMKKNTPRNNIFEVKLLKNSRKINIILSTNSDFDLEEIEVKAL